MSIRTFPIFLGVVALSTFAWAGGAGGVNGPFIEQRGVLEFTGTMIVRPLQPDALARRGFSATDIAQIRTRAVGRIRSLTKDAHPEIDTYVVRLPVGYNENTYSQSLMRTGEYEYATPNWRCYPVGAVTPNDPLFANQWHHKTMQSALAWGVWKGTSNITVSVVDTGVFTNHPDLKAGIVKGYNSVDRKAEVDGGDVQDLNGHGTHVAGDAAAQGNNSVGVVGEGWGFRIMPVRTSNDPSGGASIDDITMGARWAIEHGAKIASASYSGVDAPVVGTTGTYIKSKGGLFCYAAGNDNRDLSGFSYADTIVVGASDPNDKKAGFSAYGKGVAVFAPGVNILSTTKDGNYAEFSGTSMATPVTNGALALIWSINTALTPNQVQAILYNNCDQIGPSNIFGHGRVNLYKIAVAANATKSVNVDYAANALKLMVGTYKAGSLSNVIAGTGIGYQTASAYDPRTGYSTAVEVSWKIGATLDKVSAITPTFRVSATAGPALIAMVYAYNPTTKVYTLVRSLSMPTTGVNVTVTAPITSGFAPYIAADGTVKAVLRVFSPIGRRGVAGGPFTSNLRYSKLVAAVKNS